jgi:hypothetical protein
MGVAKVATGAVDEVAPSSATSGITKALKSSQDYIVPITAAGAGFGLTTMLASKSNDSKSESGSAQPTSTSSFLSPTNMVVSGVSSSSCMLIVGWIVFLVMSK